MLHRFIVILLCFAAFFVACAIAFFHGYEYMEEFQLTKSTDVYETAGSYKGQSRIIFRNGQPTADRNNMDYTLSWSYGVAWLACIFAFIAAIFFLCGGRLVRKSKRGVTYSPTSSMQPLELAPGPGQMVKQPMMVPMDNYGYINEPQEVFFEDPRDPYGGGGPRPIFPPAGPQSYEVVDEYYTPDGKPVSNLQYIEPRLLAKY